MKKVAIAASVLAGFTFALIGVYRAGFRTNIVVLPENISPGVIVRQDGLVGLHAELDEAIAAAPARAMKQTGLAGATGGAHLKLTSGIRQELMLPIPQLADGQVPVCCFIRCSPPDPADEFRLRKREDCNIVFDLRLVGRREVQVTWSAIVLLTRRTVTPNTTPPAPYRAATACVQSDAAEIAKLASDLWPGTGKVAEFAANIQRHIRETKRKEQPRSLDALGIMRSGDNSICTANANLAAALMRARGIACRSVAVVPPLSWRLEMHRIVEFFDDNRWQSFDPSSVQTDIPLKSWQNIIMTKTTVWDEQVAAKPRAGAMLGGPYGQEAEMLSSGITLFGQDFLWSMAKPLAEFEPSDEVVNLAVEAWNRFLETGTLNKGQLKAASAKTATALAEALRTK